MRGLIQRVSRAEVRIDGEQVGAIGRGLLLFLAVEKGDGGEQVDKLLHKLINYRIFPDSGNKMNLSLLDVTGGILVISQFTLAADTERGLRPSFSSAAASADAERLYDFFLEKLRAFQPRGLQVASGRFAADMQVSLVNDGPVTFLLQV